MLIDPSDITVVVLSNMHDQAVKRLQVALRNSGMTCSVMDASEASRVCSQNASGSDVIIADTREDLAVEELAASRLPLVALLGSVNESNVDLEFADELITEQDIGSAVLVIRIQRLVARFRHPISLERRRAPEFDLIKSLVNTTKDQIYIKDLQHRFLFAGERFAHSNGLKLNQIIGQDDLQIGSNPMDVLGSAELGWLGFWAQDDAAVAAGSRTSELNPEWRALLEDTR